MIQLATRPHTFSAVTNGLKFAPRTFWADHSENPNIRTDRMKLYARKCDTAMSEADLIPVKVIPDDPDSRDAMRAIILDVILGGNGDGEHTERVKALQMYQPAVVKTNRILKALGFRAQKEQP